MLAGLIGAAANVGYLIVGLISLVLVSFITGFGNLLLNVGLSPSIVASLTSGQGLAADMMIVGAPARSTDVFHHAVGSRISQMGRGARPRRNIPLGHARFVGCVAGRDRRGVGRRDVVAGVPLLCAQRFDDGQFAAGRSSAAPGIGSVMGLCNPRLLRFHVSSRCVTWFAPEQAGRNR